MWDPGTTMKKPHGLVMLCALVCWSGAEALAAGWKDVLPRHFRGVQYYGARRYVRPIAPQTQPAAPQTPPPAAVAPTPPPLPGSTPSAAPPAVSPQAQEKNKAEKEAALKRTIDFQKKRAEDGSATAQYDLGKRYLTGDGLEKNLPEARKWFEAAAKQGHEAAAARLEEVKKLEAAAAAPPPKK